MKPYYGSVLVRHLSRDSRATKTKMQRIALVREYLKQGLINLSDATAFLDMIESERSDQDPNELMKALCQ